MSKNMLNKTTEAPVAETEETVVKEAAPAVKEEAKKPGRKPGRKPGKAAGKQKKEPAKTDVVLEIYGKSVSLSALEDKVKAQFVADGHRAGCIKNLEIYAKPEEGKAYYVINDAKFTGDVDLF